MLLLASAPRTLMLSLRQADWTFLLSLADKALAAQWQAAAAVAATEAHGGPPGASAGADEAGPFTTGRVGARRAMDQFVTEKLARIETYLRCRECAEPGADARTTSTGKSQSAAGSEPLGGGPWAVAELAALFGTALALE
mmetsp:Transcript_2634/g.6969  ORF Transcript_2634/g.6969 Transcript_2634/m.6969 type:complete len:140 (+) Transcript_2634:230-649(+)